MENSIKRLDSLINNEKSGYLQFKGYSLNNMKQLLNHFGNPEGFLKTVHIAGTNGKGSVASMLNQILINSGYNVGLYTSPHLLKINERIKINNIDIPTCILNTYIDELFQILEENKDLHPTYFDSLTLFAFRYFCNNKADIVIIEAGLGGRLDSTNVISPLISIITDISMDHRNILGNTIKDIAFEKAGIIKPDSITITSNIKREITDIIKKETIKSSSKLFMLNNDFKARRIRNLTGNGFSFDFLCNNELHQGEAENGEAADFYYMKDVLLSIPCRFQINNSLLAITSALLLKRSGFIVTENNIKNGIAKVSIQGRYHIISQNPLIIFDPAHNPAALKTIIKTLKNNYPDKKIHAIISFMKDKDYLLMIKMIKQKLTNNIFYYELDDERCYKISDDKIGKNKSSADDIKYHNNLLELSNDLLNEVTNDSLLFVTGSFRLFNIAREISSFLSNRKYS